MSPRTTFIPNGVIPAVCCRSITSLRSTRRASAGTCAMWPHRRHFLDHHQCSLDRGCLLHVRRAASRARDHAGRDRRSAAARQRNWADGSIEAARIARMATAGGAAALLVFPPAPFTLGQSPEMALAHFKRIADATDLPLIAFQYPLATGQGYPRDTLIRLCESCRRSAPSRIGAATSCSTNGMCAPCKAFPARSTCCRPTAPGC